MMNSQKSYTGKINLIKEGKKIDIGEVIKHNEIINKSLKFKTMPSYCLKCRKNTESINPRVSKTNGKTIILSKCAICGAGFIKKQEPSGIFSNLGLKTLSSENPLLDVILFQNCKMNELVNRFLLSGDKFMPEMHLKQSGFTYSARGPFTKNK